MTSNYEQNQVSKKANEALDIANDSLSDDVLLDIAQARRKALQQGQKQRAVDNLAQRPQQWWERMRREVLLHQFHYVAPAAVAVIVAVLVSYNLDNTVPVIPEAFLSSDVPSEELAMLEDLEFASWLAEQQQEGHL